MVAVWFWSKEQRERMKKSLEEAEAYLADRLDSDTLPGDEQLDNSYLAQGNELNGTSNQRTTTTESR